MDYLYEYKETIGSATCAATGMQFLSYLYLTYVIRKNGKSDGYAVDSFIGGCVITFLNGLLSHILENPTMIYLNATGFLINIAVIIFIYAYASRYYRVGMFRKFALGLFVISLSLLYAYYEEKDKFQLRFEWAIRVLLVTLAALPLVRATKKIRNYTKYELPLPIIGANMLNAVVAAMHGFALENTLIIYQNFLMIFIYGARFQLAIRCKKHSMDKSEEKSKQP